jgi:hypothetical protein
MNGRRKIEWLATARHTGTKITPKEGDTESSVFRAAAGQAFLAGVAKTFVSGIAEIQSRYKSEIQPEQIKQLANELLNSVQSRMTKDFLNPIASSYRNMQGDIFKLAISPFNDSVAAIRRMEIRQHLRSLDGKQRLEIFNQAVENGGDEIINAFIENSKFFSLLDPALIEQGKRKWLQRKDPTLAEAFLSTEQAGSVLSSNFESIIGDLAAYASAQPERIQKLLADIPKPGWTHLKSGDEKIIDSGVMASMLPPPSGKFSESAESRFAEANKSK